MKAILAVLTFAVFAVLMFGQENHPSSSTGPTMLVITNDIQWSAAPNGPWSVIASNWVVVWVYPENRGYYRAVLHSSGQIPH